MVVLNVLRGTSSRNIDQVRAWLLESYEHGDQYHQFPTLGLSWFTNVKNPRGHLPKLKGNDGQEKHLVKPMLRVWRRCRAEISEVPEGAVPFGRVDALLGHL
eukprot:3574676-Pyramimonas_sp.AAC.1